MSVSQCDVHTNHWKQQGKQSENQLGDARCYVSWNLRNSPVLVLNEHLQNWITTCSDEFTPTGFN